ncbi:MAG: 16S rRNA (uracil(1498)-N(3))-methyltransferase [Abditibacteriota bacterium]|nr:16S rRNA (uracil(1498)-N(3))-methyltransferase [Abditibacteriota bacterium]
MKNQYRFFVDRDLISGCSFIAGPELGRQLGRILRLADGDKVSLFGRNKKEFIAGVAFHGREITLTPLDEITENREPEARLTLLLALSKKDKPEFQVQKCTELGAAGFIFVCSQRSVARPSDTAGRLDRLARIAAEASEQCGRLTVPDIRFSQLTETDFSPYDTRLVCQAAGCARRLAKVPGRSIIAAIGPEGGFAPDELDFFLRRGFEAVSLGGLTLRSETAAVAAAACLLI